MFDVISSYAGYIKPATLEQLVELERLFQSLEYDKHAYELNVIQSGHAVPTEAEEAAVLETTYYQHARDILTEMGITVNDDVQDYDFSVVLVLIKGMLALGEWAEGEELQQLLDNADLLETAIHEALAAVTDKDVTYFQQYVAEVSPSLRQRLLVVAGNVELARYEDADKLEKARQLLAKLDPSMNTLAMTYVQQAGSLPVNAKALVELLQDELEELVTYDLATNLLVIAAAAYAGSDAAEVAGDLATMVVDEMSLNTLRGAIDARAGEAEEQ